MPNLHPFFVHFPIALLTLGLFTEIWALASKDDTFWKFSGWIQAAGTVGLLTAVGTGIFAGQSEVIPDGARTVFDAHQQGAFISAAIFAALGLWRAGARGNISGSRRTTFLMLYAAGVGIVLSTGWYGGRMVFEYGVGVIGNSIR